MIDRRAIAAAAHQGRERGTIVTIRLDALQVTSLLRLIAAHGVGDDDIARTLRNGLAIARKDHR